MGDSNSSASVDGLNATETPELGTAQDDLSAGNATEVSSWDALYGRFTERNAGACLNPDEVLSDPLRARSVCGHSRYPLNSAVALLVLSRRCVCSGAWATTAPVDTGTR